MTGKRICLTPTSPSHTYPPRPAGEQKDVQPSNRIYCPSCVKPGFWTSRQLTTSPCRLLSIYTSHPDDIWSPGDHIQVSMVRLFVQFTETRRYGRTVFIRQHVSGCSVRHSNLEPGFLLHCHLVPSSRILYTCLKISARQGDLKKSL